MAPTFIPLVRSTLFGLVVGVWLFLAPPVLRANPDLDCPNCVPPALAIIAVPPGPIVDPPTPSVRIQVRVPTQGTAGQDLEYRIKVENCSGADAHQVIVKNPVPANARFIYSKPEPTTDDPELQWNLGSMAPGACKEILLFLRPTNKEDIKNCTRVQFEHGQCVTTHLSESRAGDQSAPKTDGTKPDTTPPPGKIPSQTTQPPELKPDEKAKLSLSVSGPGKQYLNLPAHYFATVRNVGKFKATNVLVEANLAAGSTFVSASDDGTFLAGQIAWLLGDIEPGQTLTVSFLAQAQSPGQQCQKIHARADRDVSSEVAESCTLFEGISALMLEMADREDPIEVGGETSYPIRVTNQGSLPITNVKIRAIIPEGMQLTRAKGPADHRLGVATPKGQEFLFDPVVSLPIGKQLEYEIYVKGLKAGDQRFHIELTADQLEAGPVIEEESTRVYSDAR